MTQYIVFLRGINVGGRIVKMADLKVCFEKMGFTGVTTLLQTGNVLFESEETDIKKLKRLVEAKLTETFRYLAKVQVFTIDTLSKIVSNYPFDAAGNSQHDYVIFVENGLEEPIIKEEYILAPGEQVKAGNGVVYWRVDKGSTLKSSFAKLLTKAEYRDFNTNRNLKTLRKLLN